MKFFGSPNRSCAVCSAVIGTIAALSSASGWDCACAIDATSTNQPRIAKRNGLCRGGDRLMPDVFSSRGVNRVLRDVRSVIADAFETTGNKNQIEITAQLLGILRHSVGQAAVRNLVHVIQIFFPCYNLADETDSFAYYSIGRCLEL